MKNQDQWIYQTSEDIGKIKSSLEIIHQDLKGSDGVIKKVNVSDLRIQYLEVEMDHLQAEVVGLRESEIKRKDSRVQMFQWAVITALTIWQVWNGIT